MRPITLAVTGVASSSVAPMNVNTSPFNVGFGVTVSGTVTYKVQHTFDDVWSSTFNPATANWFDHPTITGLSAAADGNYAFPVTAIRVTGTAGSGTATMRLIQAGIQ
jgi:hypothetical protein